MNGSWQDEKPEGWVDIPVGTPVRYWPGFREGLGRISITTSPVYIIGGAPCVTVERYSGGVALTHVELIPIPERTEQ